MLPRRGWPLAVILILWLSGCQGPIDADIETQGFTITPAMRDQWYTNAAGKPLPPARDLTSELLEHPGMSFSRELSVPSYPLTVGGETIGPERTGAAAEPPVERSDAPVDADFNFAQAAMTDVLPVFAQLLGFNYVVEGTLTGTVTMSVHEQMSRKQLWQLFLQLLRYSGITATYRENVVHIRAVSTTPQELNLTEISDDVEVGVFRIQNIAVTGVATHLKNFLGREVRAVELAPQGLLLVLDTKPTLARIAQLLAALDQPVRRDWNKRVLPCHYVPADQLAKELANILPVLGFPVALNTAATAEGAIMLTNLDRLEVIVASAANPAALDELERWIEILDRADVGDQEQIFIYDIYNAGATELINALQVMFQVVGRSITQSNTGVISAPQEVVTPSDYEVKAATTPGSVFDAPVRIFSDAVHNRLVIRTRPRTYAMIKALLERLDTVPSQVLLQVLVIEVTLSDQVNFGIEFNTESMIDGWASSTGTDYKNLITPSADPDAEQYGFKYWLSDPNNPDQKFAYLKALAAQTNVKVISSPQLMVISNNEANISVGNNVPIIVSDLTNTNSSTPTGTTMIRNVIYRDTGIKLNVTPQVTRGGRIALNLIQEVSEAIQNTSSTIDSPEIQERKLKTVMNIRDGQTIVCGGIIRDRSTDNLDTVPIIGQIPFLRRLFGDTTVSTVRTEMLILVTGTIVNDLTRLETLTRGFEQSVDSLIEFQEGPRDRKTRQFKHSGNLETWFFE